MTPNFIIVGAAKSGTSSVYEYLRQHPEIYFSEIKEPHYFSKAYKNLPFAGPMDKSLGSTRYMEMDFSEYKKLFDKNNNEKIIAEASADYLYYSNCADDIKETLGDIHILIILRNPIDRAYSAYMNMVRDGREKLSFEMALNAELIRRKQNWDFMWYYKELGFYSDNVRKYLETFTNVKICLFDELVQDSESLIMSIFEFLSLEPYNNINFNQIHNASGLPRLPIINRMLKNNSCAKNIAKRLSSKNKNAIKNFINSVNLKKTRISDESRRYLEEIYSEDITKLEKVIGRDLSMWRK